jgi:hypothetical protein
VKEFRNFATPESNVEVDVERLPVRCVLDESEGSYQALRQQNPKTTSAQRTGDFPKRRKRSNPSIRQESDTKYEKSRIPDGTPGLGEGIQGWKTVENVWEDEADE